MKRTLAILSCILLLAATAAGCGANENGEATKLDGSKRVDGKAKKSGLRCLPLTRLPKI